MTPNKSQWHIHVLPEDDRNRQIARGFVINNPDIDINVIRILPIAGGWMNVVDEFENVHAYEMKNNPYKRIVLMVDFDNQLERRLSHIKSKIPEELSNRVFILGVLSEPEDLKAKFRKTYGTYEKIGEALSQDCSDNTRKMWGHDLLKHNQAELDRLVSLVKPFLFNQA